MLVATATHGLAAARMPRALSRAGFDVSLLIPQGSIAEKSRFVSRIGYLAQPSTPDDWVYAFAATVKATAPRLVLPCDDGALRQLSTLALARPPLMQPALHLELAALIAESLGDPAHYASGTERAPTRAAGHAPGRAHAYLLAAWKGTLLCGVAVEALERGANGSPSVVRFFRSDAMREAASQMTQAFGLTGICTAEFTVREPTGEPLLVGLDRRMSQATHRCAEIEVDPCAALHAALHGVATTTRPELDLGEEHLCALFPAEWHRDPHSRRLRECPVDAPWDEPELFEALLAGAIRGRE